MTTNKTYNQLYWDKEFVEGRIQEQKDYLRKFIVLGYTGTHKPYWWSERGWGKWRPNTPFYHKSDTEKVESAKAVLQRFKRQLENINKLIW